MPEPPQITRNFSIVILYGDIHLFSRVIFVLQNVVFFLMFCSPDKKSDDASNLAMRKRDEKCFKLQCRIIIVEISML